MAENDVRGRQMLADITELDSVTRWQDMRSAPSPLTASGFAAGATFLAAAEPWPNG